MARVVQKVYSTRLKKVTVRIWMQRQDFVGEKWVLLVIDYEEVLKSDNLD